MKAKCLPPRRNRPLLRIPLPNLIWKNCVSGLPGGVTPTVVITALFFSVPPAAIRCDGSLVDRYVAAARIIATAAADSGGVSVALGDDRAAFVFHLLSFFEAPSVTVTGHTTSGRLHVANPTPTPSTTAPVTFIVYFLSLVLPTLP